MGTALVRQASFGASPLRKRCSKCGKLVMRSAFQCRRCGKRQRMSRKSLLLIVSACLMVAMFGAAALGGAGQPPPATFPVARTGGPASNAAAATPASGPKAGKGLVRRADDRDATRMTAAELWLEYAQDAVAADHRLRGRPIVVSGIVRAIERDFDGRPVVRLSTDDPLDTVNAKLATREDPSLRDLVKGRPASLGCVGRGALIGAPLLGDCVVR